MSVKLPKYEEFLLPTLKALAKLGGSATNEEVEETLIETAGLTPEQFSATYPKSGAPVLPDRMSWARSYLKYPGFVTNPNRGVWVLTEEGRTASEWPEEKVRQAVRKAAPASRKSKTNGTDRTREGQPDENGEQIPGWDALLLTKLQEIEPPAFERLCQRLLRESGFTKVEVTGRPNDGGIDGKGVLRVNLVSFHVLFQCKRYKGSVAVDAVRNFRGAMQGRADKGLIITTGTFTPEARKEATRDGAPAIDLIDGEALCELLKDRKLGVEVKMIEEITVDPAFFDAI